MALAERAELVARLSLKDELSGKLKGVEGRLGSLGRTAGRTGKALSIGLGAGLAVGAGLTLKAVRSGLDSLAELESATTSVDAAIKQMGLTGKVTAGQIAGWANEIEASVGAAFDDKAITAAATTLIRYGKVSEKNIRPALVVMTDLAAKTGSVESASALLAKALADPAKAAGKLARAGVILTKTEQDQIKALVKAGKTGEAQALVLKALERATKGAAAASQGPYQRSISVLKDAWEDATKALAVGFLPVLEEVRDILSKELAKPSTLARIKEFGEGLAGGLRGLVSAAKGVDWDSVGSSLKLAGQGAKAVYDAFMGMPDWVKTAVLTGWGLNKLSGGALGGALGSGIEVGLKGVFGQFFARGASPANPMWVQSLGGGVGGGMPLAPVGGAGLFATVLGFTPVIVATVLGLGVFAAIEGAMKNNEVYGFGVGANHARVPLQNLPTPKVQRVALSERAEANLASAAASLDALEANRLEAVTGARATTAAVREAKISQIAAQRTGDSAVIAAIRTSRPILNVRVNVSNSVRTTVYRTGTTINRTSTGVRGALLGA